MGLGIRPQNYFSTDLIVYVVVVVGGKQNAQFGFMTWFWAQSFQFGMFLVKQGEDIVKFNMNFIYLTKKEHKEHKHFLSNLKGKICYIFTIVNNKMTITCHKRLKKHAKLKYWLLRQ